MRMFASLVDTQIAELAAAERAAREHALDGLFDNAFREAAFENEFCRTCLDTARITGEVMIDLLVALPAGQIHFVSIDADDIAPIVQTPPECRGVLAPQPK